jgi:SAM-dependent methyltransferase
MSGKDSVRSVDSESASPWVRRFASLIRPGGSVLDLACGRGRHARWLKERGFGVTATDRNGALLEALAAAVGVETVCADLEARPWPFPGRLFDAVVVTNYLHRPLFPHLRAALAEDGVLIYETFAEGNAAFGRPSNPAFLLTPGELLRETGTLQVVAFEQGVVSLPAVVQRICALRRKEPAALPAAVMETAFAGSFQLK